MSLIIYRFNKKSHHVLLNYLQLNFIIALKNVLRRSDTVSENLLIGNCKLTLRGLELLSIIVRSAENRKLLNDAVDKFLLWQQWRFNVVTKCTYRAYFAIEDNDPNFLHQTFFHAISNKLTNLKEFCNAKFLLCRKTIFSVI